MHTSVLKQAVVDALAPKSGGLYVDATLGAGGHAEAILEASSPAGRLLGTDRDPTALQLAKERLARFGDRVVIEGGRFSELEEIARRHGFHPADGVLADLGVSSMQLDDPARGFSFSKRGPLDMRMGPSAKETAKDLLARVDRDELAAILIEGEVDHPKRIADAIIEARDAGWMETTKDLADAVERAAGPKKKGRIHPATLVFQALRIAVNEELKEIDALLEALPRMVKPGGIAAIISFHSLEDRRVKHAFRDPEPPHLPYGFPAPPRVKGPFEPLQRKPITPSEDEERENPRARSAKLRAAQRREEPSE